MTVWEVLGIEATADARDIKRAYARKLKVTRPDDDPTAFQLLNDAFQHAQAYARHHAHAEDVIAHAPVEGPAGEAVHATVIEPAAPVALVQPAPAPPPGPSAAEQASTLWTAFIGTSTVQPRLHLNRLADGDALISFEVREQFELCAARYCASAACSHDLREAVAAHFGWNVDHALIARAAPRETQMLFALLRAEESYALFLPHQHSDPAIKALLATRPPVPWLQTCDARLVHRMRDLLQTIRAHHPEMLHMKLDQTRFAAWEARVARKRYYAQTALYSALATASLATVVIFVLASLGVRDDWFAPVALAAALVCFGGFAWYAFSPGRSAQPFRNSALGTQLHELLHDRRYRPRWQFGWVLPYACASTAMFLPQPSHLVQYVVAATLALCVLAASFASSVVVNGVAYFSAIAVGIGMGPALAIQGMAFHPVTCSMMVYCAFLMLIRGGPDLLAMSPVPPAAILPLRGVWLAGVAIMIGAAQLPAARDLPALYAAVSWLWFLAGVVLTRPSVHFLFALIGAVVFSGLISHAVPQPTLLTTQPMSQVFAALLFVTIFMVVNMVRARSTQHPFS